MKNDALKIFENTRIGTLATMNQDGSPWSTPVLLSLDGDVVSWVSGVDAIHSQNLARDGRVSISVYDATGESSRAVYISSIVAIAGETFYSNEYQMTMTKYLAQLGELDEGKSELNRYYFKFVEGTAE